MKSLKQQFLDDVSVIDCETTSPEPSEAEILEISLLYKNNILTTGLIHPENPIPSSASAINNISNKMVEKSKYMNEQFSQVYDLINTKSSFYVAHNATYEIEVIQHLFEHYGRTVLLTKENTLCTMRLAKHIFAAKDIVMESYSQQFLRYELELAVDEQSVHRSSDDCIVCFSLLNELVNLALEYNLINLSLPYGKQLVELCWKPIPMNRMIIGGKHRNKLFTDILKEDPDYFNFLVIKANDGKGMDILNEKSSRYNKDFATSVFAFMKENNLT